MKKIFFFLAFVCLAFTSFGQTNILVDKVVAVIGDRAILFSEIEEQYAHLAKQEGQMPEDARCFILDQLLTQKLLVVKAELDSVLVPDEQVEEQLDARISQILGYMGGSEEQFKEYYGKSPAEAKEEFRPDLRDQLLAQRMQADVLSRVKITPSEVIAFFNNIPSDSLPYFSAEVEVGEIVLKPEANKEQRQIAIDTLTKLRNMLINDNADFGLLAGRYSSDPGSARNGGDLGWTNRGDFVPEFEAAAYNLTKGEYSEIVKSEYGYHLIQLLERKGNRIHTRHILMKPEITQADLDYTESRLDTIRNLILTDSISFQQAVFFYSDEKTQSKNNAGRMTNPKTGSTYFEIGELPYEIFFTLDTMEVGQFSSPVRFDNLTTGETSFKVLFLMTQTEPHTANLRDDYAKIHTAALEQKKATYIEKWVKETRGKTYVKMDELFNGCEILEKWNQTTDPH